MERLSLDELDGLRQRFDEAVEGRPDIDHFCSRTDWIIPAHTELMDEPRQLRAWQGEHGFIALCHGVHPEEGWRYLQPLEAMWCFACPVVGQNAAGAASQLLRACQADASEWDVAMIGGLQPGSELLAAVARALGSAYRLGLGPGIDTGPMRGFYQAMVGRLLSRRALHLWFARHHLRDIAYILGGASGTVYRGLQFSHDHAYHPIGLGNLSQAVQIEALCGLGYTYYDLGSDVEYKRRWGDCCFDTVMLVAAK
jgi:hypothetical protein